MKKTMIATVLGLALMPLTFAAQTPAKPADNGQSTTPSSTDSSKSGVKKHKNHKKPATKSTGTATAPAAAAAPQK